MFKYLLIAVSLLLPGASGLIAQNFAPAPADKAVVYIARPAKIGFAINFLFFDGEEYIGKFNGAKYMRYECDPGEHLFWARSENYTYVEAELEAGKTYVIKAEVLMGAIVAQVGLDPITTADTKDLERIRKLIKKKSPETLTEQDIKSEADNLPRMVKKGLERYKEKKAEGIDIEQLSPDMVIEW